jgi:hypothetical protein
MAIYTGFNGRLPGWFRGMSVSAPRAMLRVYVFDHLDLRSNGLVFFGQRSAFFGQPIYGFVLWIEIRASDDAPHASKNLQSL